MSRPLGDHCSTYTVDDTTPRDGTTRNPFQQDSTRFKNAAADACGETLGGGTNDPATQIPKMLAANGGQMPQISAGGMVMMTLHQVNGDGAGPYDCMIDSTGAGTQCKLPLTQYPYA
jgi:Egh16-like virulence factor